MLKLLKVFGIILIPFILIFIYVYVSSSGLVGNLPKDGDIISKQRPVEKSDLEGYTEFDGINDDWEEFNERDFSANKKGK